MRSSLPALLVLMALSGCVTPEPLPPPGVPDPELAGSRPAAPRPRRHQVEPAPQEASPTAGTLIVAGRQHAVRCPVVSFADPRGHDAHDLARSSFELADAPPAYAPPAYAPTGERYLPGRNLAAKQARLGQQLAELQQLVDLVVVHYDACGTSRRCFEVLHEIRGLSCHFLVDADGTIYQTLDLAHTAWHAGPVNARSIGIEVAHVGAEPPTSTGESERWYRAGPDGVLLQAPPEREPTGWREGFVGRPARPERIWGRIQGQTLVQYDFTPEQYQALAQLVAELCELFPRVRPDVPRTSEGAVRSAVLSEAEIANFSGIVGHWHVGGHKVDPGPAFDWESFLAAVAARR